MTNSKAPSDANDPQTWEHVPDIPTPKVPKETSAKLLDVGGQALSKGAAVLYRNEKKALFYPHDQAQLSTLQSRAKILFLTDSNEFLSVHETLACLGECGGLVHWHLRVS